MKDQDRQALIEYRLKQAGDSIRQAEILATAGEWSGVINRAYYSMFYSALALLIRKGLGSSKHSGVLALIDREYVRTGELAAGLSRQFREAFNERQKADYAEMTLVSPEKARIILNNAREFIENAREMLRN